PRLAGERYHRHADRVRGLDDLREAPVGDIVALVGLKDSITGDTLCDGQHPILLEAITFAEAVVSQSIEPETSADRDKLVATLDLLQREDPTFHVKVDKETGQTLMSGMGMLHLEVKQQFVAAAERGLRDAWQSGGEFGYPVLHVQATIVAGQMDEQLSNETAFVAAAADAVRKAFKDNTQLLEPIMRIEVSTPDESL